MIDNLQIWNKLSKTDPDRVKRFKRPGGFSGHAVDPIYMIHKMTSIFGPCGHQWSIDKPEFTIVPCGNDRTYIACVVTVTVRDGKPIPGVGGDTSLKTHRDGKNYIDDECFKKAYTDAVGNALKYLGMAADVRYGKFDDDKYVTSLHEEKAERLSRSEDRKQPSVSNCFPEGKQRPPWETATEEDTAEVTKKHVPGQSQWPRDDGSAENSEGGLEATAVPLPEASSSESSPRSAPQEPDEYTIYGRENEAISVASLADAFRKLKAIVSPLDHQEASVVLGANLDVIDQMQPNEHGKPSGEQMFERILKEKEKAERRSKEKKNGDQ